jgi:hypothetical protein
MVCKIVYDVCGFKQEMVSGEIGCRGQRAACRAAWERNIDSAHVTTPHRPTEGPTALAT